MVHQGGHDLDVPLCLYVSTHDPEGDRRTPPLQKHRGTERVGRTPPADKLRRMARSEREATTAILENDTGPRRHEARAERAVETIDEGDDIPLPIGNHEVDGVASRPDARLGGLCGPTGIDAGRQPTKLRFVEERLHRRLHGVRIRHMGVPIGERKLHRLDQEVGRLDGPRRPGTRIEMTQDPERDQRGDPLRIGR